MTNTNLYKTLRWSSPYNPEWTTDGNRYTGDDGSPGEVNFETDAGNITGIAGLGTYFFSFLQRAHYIYAYTGSDTEPFQEIKRVNQGANFERFPTIVNKQGTEFLAYVSDIGEIRMTNGPTFDAAISSPIRTTTRGILNGRVIDNYYVEDYMKVPGLVYDKYNNVLRCFYAAEESNTSKFLTYSIDRDAWLTGDYPFSQLYPIYDTSNASSMLCGTSDGSGKTYVMSKKTLSTDKTLKFDTSWIKPNKPTNRVKLYNVELLVHTQSGCDCTITFEYYNNPVEPSVTRTVTRTLTHNSSANNLQRIFVNELISGKRVRLIISDSGTSRNYSIDRIHAEAVELNSPN